MFNLFRRKPKFGDAEKGTLIEALAGMLYTQQIAAPGKSVEDEGGNLNPKALGYIYGFVDAALTSLGQDTSNAFVSAPIAQGVLRLLFPGKEERYLDFLGERIGRDPQVTAGAMLGGQQYIDFVVRRRSDGAVPMGFARCLNSREKTE